MKVFVAGKIGKEEEAQRAMRAIREAGHDIKFDWTTIPHLKPYEQNENSSQNAAIIEAEAVRSCDALVLLADEEGIGMYVELGIALANNKPVFVVGKTAPSMFLFHPLVKRVGSLTEALKYLSST